MKFTVDYSALQKNAQILANSDELTRKRLFNVVQDVANEGNDRIKEEMPVDTGRAKAGWGHYTPGDLTKGASKIEHLSYRKRAAFTSGKRFFKRFKTVSRYTDRETKNVSREEDAIWEENPDKLQIIQGTNVPYTPLLNAGHSRQAPAGFIDKAVEYMRMSLEKDAIQILELFGRKLRGWE